MPNARTTITTASGYDIGGLAADGKTPKDTRTEEQKRALRMLTENLHKRYPMDLIVGHCVLEPNKPCCPGFDEVWVFRDLKPGALYQLMTDLLLRIISQTSLTAPCPPL